jgi:hypothetical protein
LSDYHRRYRWQSLGDACHQQGLAVDDAHDALADCRMTLALIEHIVPLGKTKLLRANVVADRPQAATPQTVKTNR